MYNFSKDDIINGKQQEKIRCLYNLDNMSACMDIGLARKRQEDSVLLLEHPLNKEFKLMAVADGMGGLINGGKASNLALLSIINWFENLPLQYYFNEKQILIEIYQELSNIDLLIRKHCGNGGTTLTISIFTKNNSIIINIGDSRAYIYLNNQLKQISNDHSICWDLYEKGIILSKDNIRFHKQNNLITSRLGCEKKKLKIDSEVITKDDYERIFLFSDGITDCLSDLQIEYIVNNNKDGDIASYIVDAALNTVSYNNNLNINEYNWTINGGKDNSSAVSYVKKLK